MNVVFCKITSMKYYKGVTDFDKPINGGDYIKQNGIGGEVYNFYPVINDKGQEVCYGFVEPKSNRGVTNTIHIENITKNEKDKFVDFVDNVLIVWCATKDTNEPAVVGWYKNALFYREIQEIEREEEYYIYNAVAHSDDCVLLPRNERDKYKWIVPVAKPDGYGFGQHMVYYPALDGSERKVKTIIESIETYNGHNWLRVFNKEQEPKSEKKYFWEG